MKIRLPDGEMVVGFGAMVVIIGGTVWWNLSTTEPPKPQPSKAPLTMEEIRAKYADARSKIAALMPPGWFALSDCGSFASFDGSWTLVFAPKNIVKSGKEEGRWEFDVANQRYTVTLGSDVQTYSLLNHDGA